MTKKLFKISYVIPCYNSERTVEGVVKSIESNMKKHISFDYEVILVNDGSKDNVFEVIRKLCKKNNKVKGINLIRNFGQHAAILSGMRYTTGEIVVCLDDDGQTDPKQVFKLIDKVNEGYDVVYAKYNNKHHSGFRNFGSRVNDSMMVSLLSKPKDLYISSYFACKRIIVDELIKYDNPYPYMQGLVLRTTTKVTNVDIEHKDREVGESNYNLKKLLNLWFNGFTAFSVKPLRIASVIGVICAVIGFIYGIIIVIQKMTGSIVALGYASLMAIVLFVGGMLMLMLGLIGEYIGRIYISLNNAPQSLIRDKINIK